MTAVNMLLVDDEQAFVEILAQRLNKRGFNAAFAFSGREALDFLRSNAGEEGVEVVILDIRMPEMDGIETLKAIKKEWPLVEVVMLTGYGSVGSAIDAMKLGAFDYLTKPCDLDELVAKASAAAEIKRNHESKILLARMKPYISEREKEELIAKALE